MDWMGHRLYAVCCTLPHNWDTIPGSIISTRTTMHTRIIIPCHIRSRPQLA